MEIWKDIKGWEDYYQVSSYGRFRGKDRYANVCGGGKRLVKGRILKPTVCTNGYLEAHLHKNGESKIFLLHRLVAMHFIENPNNYQEVNHKDEDIKNCHVDNLEWCTSKYNANYGTRNQRMIKEKYLKPVVMCDENGNKLKEYKSMGDACRDTGADISSMIRVCKGRQRTCVGYVWKYA